MEYASLGYGTQDRAMALTRSAPQPAEADRDRMMDALLSRVNELHKRLEASRDALGMFADRMLGAEPPTVSQAAGPPQPTPPGALHDALNRVGELHHVASRIEAELQRLRSIA